jgi:cytochrome c
MGLINMRNFVTFFVFILLVAGCSGTASTIPSGDPGRGAQLFTTGLNEAPPCSTCHLTVEGEQRFSLGPNLAGIGERAATRVAGLTAQDYLHQSIVDTRAYVVPGYLNIMYPDYGERLTEDDVRDLTAYLMTL